MKSAMAEVIMATKEKRLRSEKNTGKPEKKLTIEIVELEGEKFANYVKGLTKSDDAEVVAICAYATCAYGEEGKLSVAKSAYAISRLFCQVMDCKWADIEDNFLTVLQNAVDKGYLKKLGNSFVPSGLLEYYKPPKSAKTTALVNKWLA